MKKYLNYSAIDFTHDDHFLKWVKYPGQSRQRDRFWMEWTSRHPEKASEIEEAKRMILAVIEERQYIPSDNLQHEIWNKLQKSLDDVEYTGRRRSFWPGRLKVAATILLIMGAIISVWIMRTRDKTDDAIAVVDSGTKKEINNGSKPKTIVLSDGSSIILMPESTLEFPTLFHSDYREVTISGEAFFEVNRDVKRPFIVHADKLITKVLGTSFTIRAFENERNISVQVKTGKVSVYTERDAELNRKKGNEQLEGVLLTPNQQVIFSREESRMVKSLVDNPSLLNSSKEISFEFNKTPLREVFATLERAYGIRIVYDEDLMSSCELNASLGDRPLYDKLRLICKGINARYEILDSHIVIIGKGCN